MCHVQECTAGAFYYLSICSLRRYDARDTDELTFDAGALLDLVKEGEVMFTYMGLLKSIVCLGVG